MQYKFTKKDILTIPNAMSFQVAFDPGYYMALLRRGKLSLGDSGNCVIGSYGHC